MKKFMLRRLIPVFLKPLTWFSQKPKNGYRILLFHNVDDMSMFEKIIDYVAKHYKIISPVDIPLYQRENEGGFDSRPKIIISFDDGFVSNIIAAKKVLELKGIKALFFITANFVGLSKEESKKFVVNNLFYEKIDIQQVNDSQLPMAWDDIRYLSDNGHIIGSHTLNHFSLAKINDKNLLRKEIIDSGNVLESKLNKKIEWFSYPIGNNQSINSNAYKIIKERYKYCCTGLRGINTPESGPHYIYRDNIDLDFPSNYIKFIIDGGLDLYYAKNRRELLENTRVVYSNMVKENVIK